MYQVTVVGIKPNNRGVLPLLAWTDAETMEKAGFLIKETMAICEPQVTSGELAEIHSGVRVKKA